MPLSESEMQEALAQVQQAQDQAAEQLQNTAETVLGVTLHKQNLRRLVEKSGFLEATGKMSKARGRPAELFKFRHQERSERPLAGLRVSSGRTRSSEA